MSTSNGFDKTAIRMAKTFNLNIKEKAVIDRIALHIDALCFNVASVITILSLVDNNKINDEVIAELRKYINHRCFSGKRKQGGGTVMTSEYYGYVNDRYTVENGNTGTTMSDVNFADGVARPALGAQLGGGPQVLCDKLMEKSVRNIIKHNNIRLTKEYFDKIMKIICSHMHCLIMDLKNSKNGITVAHMDKLMKMKRHRIFN
jgi:hypothetical protein